MRQSVIFGLIACLCLAAPACAQDPGPTAAILRTLKASSQDSVDISFGRVSLTLLAAFMDDNDADGAAIKTLFRSLKSLSVHHYEFGEGSKYASTDIATLRSQIADPQWSRIVEVHDEARHEDVDISVAMTRDKISGVVIIATQPREVTVITADGSLDLDEIDRLRRHFRFRHGESGASNAVARND